MMRRMFQPEPERPKLVTGWMKDIMTRTLNGGRFGGTYIWLGAPGTGKTTLALHLMSKSNRSFESEHPKLHAFRATHYHVGSITKGLRNEAKWAIKSLYEGALGRLLSPKMFKESTTENLALITSRELQAENIRMVFIDDSNCLSVEHIRAMMLSQEISEHAGWSFKLVFIGSEDLARVSTQVPAIARRIVDWCHFAEFDFEETWMMLGALHPHFKTLDRNKYSDVEQVRFIHEQVGKCPSSLTAFTRRMENVLSSHKGGIDLFFLRAVHFLFSPEAKIATCTRPGSGRKIMTVRKV
jgi:hypothetical protein